MTNAEKFMEVMNETFNAGFTKGNLTEGCTPWGALKTYGGGCGSSKCPACRAWWEQEFRPPEGLGNA